MEVEAPIPFRAELQTLFQDKVFQKKLVLWLHYLKKETQDNISEQVRVSQATVSRIIGRWASHGDIEGQKGQGRHSEISAKEERQILELQNVDRLRPATSIHREMIANGSNLSYHQVWSAIGKTFHATYAPYQIKLSQDNRSGRLKWAQSFLSWRQWKRDLVIWTDEKIFCLYPQSKKMKVKLLADESPEVYGLPQVQQGGGHIMIWGAIGISGQIHHATLHGKIDSKTFSKFLRNEALPAIKAKHPTRWILQQDNAPPHKGETLDVIEEEKIETVTWPAKSPDLNPIEQVWGWMAKEVDHKSFKNLHELEECVYSIWEKVPKDVILAYIKKLNDKAQYVLDNNGDVCPSHM